MGYDSTGQTSDLGPEGRNERRRRHPIVVSFVARVTMRTDPRSTTLPGTTRSRWTDFLPDAGPMRVTRTI